MSDYNIKLMVKLYNRGVYGMEKLLSLYGKALKEISDQDFYEKLDYFLNVSALFDLKMSDIQPPTLQHMEDFLSRDYTVESEFEDIPWPLYLTALPLLDSIYQDLEIDRQVLNETVEDLVWRLTYYQNHHKSWGLSAEDKMWLARIYHLKIFKLGSLQFEPLDSSALSSDLLDDLHMSGQQKMLSVHIMYGQDLSPSACLNSFDRALHFFDRHFPDQDFEYFYCQSWLLYPPLKEVLGEKSRIRQFMDFFHIVSQEAQADLPYRYIFYKKREDVQASDVKTRLQAFAFEHPDRLGIGTGIVSCDEMREIIDEKR